MSETPRFKQGDFIYTTDRDADDNEIVKRVLIVNVRDCTYEVIDPKHTQKTMIVWFSCAMESIKEYYERKLDHEKYLLSTALRDYNKHTSYYKLQLKKLKEAEKNHE